MASPQQFLRLLPDDLSLLFVELSSSLTDRLDAGVHSEAMTQEIRVNVGHISGGPREGVEVSCNDLRDLVLRLSAQRLQRVIWVSIIWVWNAVSWASGSFTHVKETFGPRHVGNTTFMIACKNGMGRALSGTGGARSSAARSPTCCKSLQNSSLALRNSVLSARGAATSTWRARIVSRTCCVVTLFPSGGALPSDLAAARLVLLILLAKTPYITVSGTLF